MFIQENFLDTPNLVDLKHLIDNEIKTSLCIDAPPYQSYNYMHKKHADNFALKNLLDRANTIASTLVNKNLNIEKCWFNIARSDSNFGFHTHPYQLAGVFFLEGCKDYGTLFKINNATLQLIAKDNSMLFFDPSIEHSIPKFNNIERYTIAIDFN